MFALWIAAAFVFGLAARQVGLPPLVGFLGKIYLFGSAIAHSEAHPEYIWLVIIAVLNSAIAAVYYLRIASAVFFGQPSDDLRIAPVPMRRAAATIAALLALALGFTGRHLVERASVSTPTPARSDKPAKAVVSTSEPTQIAADTRDSR